MRDDRYEYGDHRGMLPESAERYRDQIVETRQLIQRGGQHCATCHASTDLVPTGSGRILCRACRCIEDQRAERLRRSPHH